MKQLFVLLLLVFGFGSLSAQCEVINDQTKPCGSIYTDWLGEDIVGWNFDQTTVRADDLLNLYFSDLSVPNGFSTDATATHMVVFNDATKLVRVQPIPTPCDCAALEARIATLEEQMGKLIARKQNWFQ